LGSTGNAANPGNQARVCGMRPWMREVDDELAEIKREIIESRGLVIKTNNLTNALSADIKSIAKRQQSYERRLSLNSATAYVVFVLVSFTALKFAWDARIDFITSETQQKTADNERLRKEMRETQKRDEDRSLADAKAAAFYELVRQNKRVEMIEGFDAVRKEPLSKTELAAFTDAVDRARNELSAQLYREGQDKTRVQRWQEAATAYEDSLKYKDDSAVAVGVKLGLAEAYRHLGRQRDAIAYLASLAESTQIDKEVQDDALYQLAYCQMEMQSWNDAKGTWRSLIHRFPDSHYVAEARLQLQALTVLH
jgi:TolA-binding protein